MRFTISIIAALLIAVGFTHPSWTSYALGTACLYRAAKP